MSGRTRKILTFAVPAVLLAGGAAVAAWMFLFDVREPEPLVISRETTFVTGPLKPDGSVDFVAAINRHYGEGVRPEDNAAVGLLAAVGTDCLSDEQRARLYDLLGTPPSDHPPPFVPWRLFQNHTDELPYDVQERPWRADEFPLVAGWLEANEDALALVSQAVQKPKFYVPLVFGNLPPRFSLHARRWHGYTLSCQTVYTALTLRTWLRIEHNDLEGAWADFMTQANLARHLAHCGPFLDWFLGRGIERGAMDFFPAIQASETFTARFGTACLADMELIGPLRGLDDTLDRYHRLMVLHSLADRADRWPEDVLQTRLTDWFLLLGISRNRALTELNGEIDRFVDILRLPPSRKRSEWAALQRSVSIIQDRIRQARNEDDLRAMESDITATPGRVMFAVLWGKKAYEMWFKAQVNSEARFQLQRLAMAAGCYRVEHGRPPTGLEDVATYLDGEIPVDPATGEPFGYETSGEGFRIFSRGGNGEFDVPGQLHNDDPVIEVGMPRPTSPSAPSAAHP